MIPYYLLRSSNFDPNTITSLSSGSQVGINTIDNTPSTLIQKNSINNLIGFCEYNLTTEILKHQKGRAYGNSDIFQNFILIKEDKLFFNQSNNLLVLSTSKVNFQNFTKRFKKNAYFNFETILVDFPSIINNVLNLGTDGVWLGNLDNTNINAVGLMGHKVQDSSEYQEYIESGAVVTNLSFIYNFNGTQEKIMISREGGIILYQSKPINEALPLVIDVYKEMLLKN